MSMMPNHALQRTTAIAASLNQVVQWIFWWHSTEASAEDVSAEQVSFRLNTDFEAALLSPPELQALVSAWQAGAISRDTLMHNLRQGELLPPGRTDEQEVALIGERTTLVNGN